MGVSSSPKATQLVRGRIGMQTQEVQLQSSKPLLWSCPVPSHVSSCPTPGRFPRGCGQWSRALGSPALPIFMPNNDLSSKQLGTSPKTDSCQRQLTKSLLHTRRVGLWHGAAGAVRASETVSSR